MIDEQWDLPLLEAFHEETGGLPSLPMMVGRYIGYKPRESQAKRRETDEEAAARILGAFGVSAPPPRQPPVSK